MVDATVILTGSEREYLIQVLETALKSHRVEEHRTRSPSYREHIVEEAKILTDLLTKLGKPPQGQIQT